MWPFSRTAVVTFAKLEGHLVRAGIPKDLIHIPDPAKRARLFDRYIQVRQRLFLKHLNSLSRSDRRRFATGTHPSQSHSRAAAVQPLALELERHLADRGISALVQIGYYQMDRLVLDVELTTDPGARSIELPWLFRGFEVKYHGPTPTPGSG